MLRKSRKGRDIDSGGEWIGSEEPVPLSCRRRMQPVSYMTAKVRSNLVPSLVVTSPNNATYRILPAVPYASAVSRQLAETIRLIESLIIDSPSKMKNPRFCGGFFEWRFTCKLGATRRRRVSDLAIAPHESESNQTKSQKSQCCGFRHFRYDIETGGAASLMGNRRNLR